MEGKISCNKPCYKRNLFCFCHVFAAFALKCKVIRKQDTKSHARHIPKARPQHRKLRALLPTNSVWVL